MKKSIVTASLVVLAIYVFFAMMSNIDFTGMSLSEIKLVVSIWCDSSLAEVG